MLSAKPVSCETSHRGVTACERVRCGFAGGFVSEQLCYCRVCEPRGWRVGRVEAQPLNYRFPLAHKLHSVHAVELDQSFFLFSFGFTRF